MSILNLDAASLRNLIKRLEQRDALLAELKKVEAEIFSLAGEKSAPAPAKAGRKVRRARKKVAPPAAAPKAPAASSPASAPKGGKRRARRGVLTTKILSALKKAGSEGLSVPEISKKLKTKPQNIHVWFSSTGKSLPEIHKEGKGRQARIVHAG